MKSKDWKFFMVGAVGTTAVLLVCILCGLIVILKPGGWEVPSWPLRAAATPSPQATVGTPTPAPPLATPLQGVLFHDDFGSRDTSAAKGWNLTPDEHFERTWSPNRLTILAKDAQQRYLQTVTGDHKDLGIEIEAQPDVEDIFYGILFRQNEAGGTINYYFYFVTTDGFYFLYKDIGDELTPLVNGAPSTHLKTGLAKNRLGVLTEGATISLYINGHLEKTLTDDSLSSGSAGVVVFRMSEGQGQVHFSRVTVYSVERAKTELANPDNTMATTLAGVLFYDDFGSEQASRDKGWLSGTQDVDEIWAPGKLTFSLKEKSKVYSSNPRGISYALDDCGVEIEAQPEDNPGTGYGIVFRRSDGGRDGYYFGATLDGQYSLLKETNGEWAAIVPLTSSPHLKPGPSKNRLGVLAEGPVISLYINGLLVQTVTDDSLASGSVALYARSSQDALARVTFNSMTVLTAERAKAEWGAPAILFDDDFSSEQASKDNGWAFGSREFFDLLWSPNKMTMVIRQNNKKVTNLPNGTFKDFGVEVELQPGSDPGTEYGILFRCSQDRSNCYYFTVSTDGQYYLVKNIGGKPADKDVVSLTDSPYIERGSAKNRLGVLAEGSMFSLYINGTRVTTVSDDSVQSGAVGAFVQASGDRAQADVYRMTVLSLEKAKEEWGATGILFHEDFSSEEASREKGFETKAGEDADLTWSPDKFTITVKKEQTLKMVALPAGTLADFGVEIEAEPADYPRTEYGLFFRLNEGESGVSHYVFGVTTAGDYHLFKKINGQWAEPDPVEQTPSPYLNPPPAKNRLGVLVEGSTISLYINGNLVKTVSDDSIKSGIITAYVGAGSERASVAFSRMTVYTVERAREELGAGAMALPTPQPTATTPPGILFHEDFSSEQACQDRGWNFELTQDVDEVWSPNRLTVALKKSETISISRPEMPAYRDFGVEVEAQPEDEPGTAYGIVFRYGGTTGARSYYLFAVTLDGEYYLQKRVEGKWADQDPVEATSSPFIQQGASLNRLGAMAEGTKISLYINGHLVKTITDDSITSGGVGLAVITGDNPLARVVFSRMTVYTVEKARTELGE